MDWRSAARREQEERPLPLDKIGPKFDAVRVKQACRHLALLLSMPPFPIAGYHLVHRRGLTYCSAWSWTPS